MVQDLEDLLASASLDSVFQLVAFHPDFQFEGLTKDDRANLVNRSPFPTLHILRFSDIEELNLTPSEASDISLSNEKKLNELSEAVLKDLFT